MYFVYILECADKTFYTGSTIDLEKRLHKHNNLKSGAHYTKIRRPVILKYFEKLGTYTEVRAREGEIKRLSREEKIKLIKINNGKIRSS
ncbi:MAG: GIY-YIG nuclease family protein [Candidatus Pacebacteria bacterium]|nr:GIY-YIG nuclease family protein [Candidatus Paceibacterota bacterium]